MKINHSTRHIYIYCLLFVSSKTYSKLYFVILKVDHSKPCCSTCNCAFNLKLCHVLYFQIPNSNNFSIVTFYYFYTFYISLSWFCFFKMETVLGLKGENFVMLAADTMMVRRLFILNDSEYPLGNNLMANQYQNHTHIDILISVRSFENTSPGRAYHYGRGGQRGRLHSLCRVHQD